MTDNPLTRLLQSLPLVVRQTIYCIVWVAGIVYGAYVAADGDWHKALLGLIPLVVGGVAHANTLAPAQVEGD